MKMYRLNASLILLLILEGATAQSDTSGSYYQRIVPAKPPKPRVKEYSLPDAAPFGATITAADAQALLLTLTSDALGGRETGEEGQRKAAEFIADQFKAMGLPPKADNGTYFQRITLQKEPWKDLAVAAGETTFKDRTDYYAFPTFNPSLPKMAIKEVVFVGYGIQEPGFDNYAGTDVRGKTVVFYDGEPLDDAGRSVITGNMDRSKWAIDWRRKVRLAKEKGAVLCLIIDPALSENVQKNRRDLSARRWTPTTSDPEAVKKDYVNSLFITPEMAAAILGKKAAKVEEARQALLSKGKYKPVSAKTSLSVTMEKDLQRLEGSNVVGFIEGSDPVLKNEYVIITAHYDHLGQVDSVIYYGADDNASGTSGVIEIAQAFAEARKKGVGPKRSVVCMLVSGEEKGLLGSQFYVDFPLFPLKSTIANVNIDMIGRVDAEHAANPDYIYVIGSDRMSSDLHNINEDANNTYTKLTLDYRFNDPADPNHFYERSDHYNFALQGIPAIFYFNGTHPDYHKPTDTPDKINFDALAKRAQLAFYTAWDLANRPVKLIIDRKN
ncbi:MAG: M28 family peptidase [Saprospiraceae bacterium]|nr:M28 family peptidase [Saprospiraceae bacterium]